jgi:predicted anti-sigma-YlaC factor YlaD
MRHYWTVNEKARLLPPDSEIGPGAHLLWAIPAALVVIGFCSTVGLLFWCGDGSAESCDDPERTRGLLTHAIWWIVAGGVMSAAIIAIAPWGRIRARLIAGIVTAVLVIGAGLIYLSL